MHQVVFMLQMRNGCALMATNCRIGQPIEADSEIVSTLTKSESLEPDNALQQLRDFIANGDYAPGEISWNIADPTIHLDGNAIWENGYLYPDRLPGGDSLIQRHPRLAALYQSPHRNIGLNG